MRKLTMLAVMGSMALAGCGGTGDDTGSDAGSLNYPKTCNADTDCLSTEVCHPIGGVCVKNCANDSTVCGDDLCVETTFNGVTAKVCKCETCAISGEVCSKDLDDVCESACTSDNDCKAFANQTRKCGTDGICKFVEVPCGGCPTGQVCDTNIDTCIDACTATSCTTSAASKCGTSGLCEACAQDTDCANVGATYKCDKTGAAPKCVSTAVTCTETDPAPGTNGGQSTCNYGDVCSSAACVDVVTVGGIDGSCSDYSWNKALQGPVITNVSTAHFSTSDSTTECGNGLDKIEVTVEFYAPNGLTYTSFKDFLDTSACATASQCMRHFSFTSTTGKIASRVGASFIRGLPTSGATYGSFTAGLCTANSLGRAVWIVDGDDAGGNAACLE